MLFFLTLSLLSVVGCIALGYTVDFFSFLFEYGKKDSVRLSFNQFIAFYKSAPDKWRLENDYVKYSRNCSEVIFSGVVTEKGLLFDEVEAVFFRSYHSLLKYRRWRSKLEKAQEERNRNQKTLALSKCWSKDINDAHAKAMREVQSMFEANLAASKQQERALEVPLREYGVDKVTSYSIEPIDGSVYVKDYCDNIRRRILDDGEVCTL